MKYIKVFEKWGINTNIEQYAKEYFARIMADKERDRFNFLYKNDKGNYYFDLTIRKNDKKENLGYFTYDKKMGWMTINLSNRNDYSTLLHELKHLDRHTRVKKTTSIRKAKGWSDEMEYSRLNYLLYLLDPDEFEAKLHGYYADIDAYLEEHLPENPDKALVLKYINNYLASYKDNSHLLYKSKSEIMIEKIAGEDYLKRLFTALMDGNVVKKNTIKYSLSKLTSLIKSIVGLDYFDDAYYTKTIRYLNKILNFNLVKFNRKFNRMCYGLVDKYSS